MKFNWKQKAPKLLNLSSEHKDDAQSVLPTGLEYIHNKTWSSGTHDMKLSMITSFGIERIQECSQRGTQVCCSVYIIFCLKLLFSEDSNASSLKVISSSLGDFFACQIMSHSSSDGIEIKETECLSNNVIRCSSIIDISSTR